MNPLPSITSNIADLFTKPISRHRHAQLFIGIGVDPTSPFAASASTATVDPASTVVASAPIPTTPASDSVPSLHPNLTLPIALDTGASFSISPSKSDFFPVTQAPYGLIRSAALVNSVAKALAFTPVDPYTLITGEGVASASDIAFASDLSSPDTTVHSDSGSSFTKVYFDIRQFGTSTLTFIYSKSTLELLHIFVTPTQVDWIHWVPLPRLILPESYFHVFGLDCLQAFTLFHLIPIWIYYLLHFAVNLEQYFGLDPCFGSSKCCCFLTSRSMLRAAVHTVALTQGIDRRC